MLSATDDGKRQSSRKEEEGMNRREGGGSSWKSISFPEGDLLRKYHTRNEKECHGWGTLVLTRDTALESSAPGTACTAHAAGSVVHRMEIVGKIELTTTLRS